jgi:tetratricopeptide (TPR) repeat protein
MTLRPASRTILSAAAVLLAAHTVSAQVDTKSAPLAPVPDRASAYYHDGLAHLYEQMAVNNGRPDFAAQAVEEYKLALNADPDSKYLQDGLADLYFKIGRIREAVTSAQDQVKKNPNDLAAHTLLGKVYLRSLNDMQGPQANEMLQLAIAEYEKIVELNPKDVESHLLLGQFYGIDKNTAKAAAQFKLAQSLDTNSEEAVLRMAQLYSEQNQPDQAVDALSAIPADDRSARINAALGASYDQLKNYKKAAEAYRASIADDPDNNDVQRALATDLVNDNQLDAALAVYRKIALNDPNDVQSLMKISEIERAQGHLQAALDSLNKAKALGNNADNPELAFQEAVLDDGLGKYDQAVTALQAELNLTQHLDRKYNDAERSNRATFLDRLAIVYNEQNKTAEAVATYKQIIDLGGDFVIPGYEGEIDAYRNAHQWKEALNASADLAKLYPKNPRVQLAYAMQIADTGDAEQAMKIANAQLTGTLSAPNPGDRETLSSIALVDLRLHRSADALAALDKADALSTTTDQHFGVYLLKATVLDRDKRYDEAEIQYKKALAIAPNNATVLNDYGYMLADRGIRLPEALAMIQKAVQAEPQNGSFLDSLGWAYYKLGQFGPAEENLHQAIDRQPTDASIHDHLGEVYEKTGRLKLAVDQWERSMTEYAHSLPADADPADIAKVKHKLEEARVKLARVTASANKKS